MVVKIKIIRKGEEVDFEELPQELKREVAKELCERFLDCFGYEEKDA